MIGRAATDVAKRTVDKALREVRSEKGELDLAFELGRVPLYEFDGRRGRLERAERDLKKIRRGLV